MKQFVDRQQEMETLQSEYERNGSALVVLYGRRRVGKTTLISEFIRDKNALFFLASEESEAQNRAAFKEKAAEFIDSDLLRNADVKSWDVIFKSIMDSPLVDILDYIRDHIRVSEVHAAKGHGNQREVDLIRNGNQCIVDLRNKDPNIKQDKSCRAHASQMPQYTALSGNIIFNGHESRYNQFVSDN